MDEFVGMAAARIISRYQECEKARNSQYSMVWTYPMDIDGVRSNLDRLDQVRIECMAEINGILWSATQLGVDADVVHRIVDVVGEDQAREWGVLTEGGCHV